MSFAVVHMQKFKVSGVKGIQFHNQRERESRTNSDIDKTRSDLNYDLHNNNLVDYNKQVKKIIEKNVVTNRAIRKDAVVMCNFIVTSDKNFFDTLNAQDLKKFFEKSYDFFKERYGEENIIAAPVHLDEKTPHMHLSLVPVTGDNKLSAKRLFDRKELRSIQDKFPKYINEHGFDLKRGVDAEGKNKHIETQKFKAIELENKVNDLEQERNSIKNDLNALKNDYIKIQESKVHFDNINAIEGKYGLINKEKVTIKTNDFENLKDIAKRQHVLERMIENLENDNQKMRSDIRLFSESRDMIFNKKHKLEKQFKDYKKEVNYIVDYLEDTKQLDKAKDFVNEKKNVKKQKLKVRKVDRDFER